MVQGFVVVVAAVVAAVAGGVLVLLLLFFLIAVLLEGLYMFLFVLPPKLAKLPRATFWAHGQES